MKAQIAQGGIFLILIITTMVVVYIIGGAEPVRRNVITVEGSLMSFENYADLLIKTFDASIEFISQRAAYDLGSNGGIEGNEIALWNLTYPSIDIMRQQLENRIKENLPQGTTQDDRTVSWGGASINVSGYDNAAVCGPIENSKCFEIDGNKSFSIYDKSIDSRISLNPYSFSKVISSNYLKLLNAGRAILEDSRFNTRFNDGTLLSELYAAEASGDPRFNDLDFRIKQISANISEVTIEEKCFDAYCLAPLKPGETGEIAGVPYDYLKLNFLINATAGNTPICDGTVALDCLIPGFVHPFDERLWGDTSCGRSNAKVDCDGNTDSHHTCSFNSCNLFEPDIGIYSVSKTSLSFGESFSINVNGNCPSGLPGKCLVECRVIHPDGNFSEVDSWSENGILTMPNVICKQAGVYTVDYCGVFTDFIANGGWGRFNFTKTAISCSSAQQFTFSVAVKPISDIATQGTPFSRAVQVIVTKTGGTAQPVSLSVSSTITKEGTITQPLPTPCTPNPTCTPAPTFTVTTISETPAGTYRATVTGTSPGSISSPATATYSLIVNP